MAAGGGYGRPRYDEAGAGDDAVIYGLLDGKGNLIARAQIAHGGNAGR